MKNPQLTSSSSINLLPENVEKPVQNEEVQEEEEGGVL